MRRLPVLARPALRGSFATRVALTAAMAAGLCALASCGGDGAAPPGPAPFVLVSIDTFPASHVGCYGAPNVRTPTLDRLARAGLQVRDAISPAPLTLPSHTTMLTGLDPPRHGVRENAIFRLEDDLRTVAELLPAGVKKAAFVGGYPLAGRFNLTQGFDVYDDDFGPRPDRRRPPERRAENVFAAARAWLATGDAGDRPFVFAHVFDPHYTYAAPIPWTDVAATLPGAGPYEGEIAYTDRELGRFLRRIDAAERDRAATILVTADHGEARGAHKEITHCMFVYDATQRVPLILAGPDQAPRLETEVRRLADITPTILAAYDVAAQPDLPGAALDEIPTIPDAYVETKHPELLQGWSPLHGIRTSRWKYIRAPRPELYDVVADPAELDNLLGTLPEIETRLAARLESILEQTQEAEQLALAPGVAEKLRSLGYVVATEPGAPADLAKDPKDGIDGAVALFRGEKAYMEGNLPAAERHLKQAIRLNPESKDAHAFLSGVFQSTHRPELAIEYATRALELVPHLDEGPLHMTIGEALLDRNRPREALPHLQQALAERPNAPRIRRLIAEAEGRLR